MTSSGGNHSIANTRPRFASNRKTGPEEGLRGGRAERNDQIRTYYLDLGVQPGPCTRGSRWLYVCRAFGASPAV